MGPLETVRKLLSLSRDRKGAFFPPGLFLVVSADS